MSMSPDSFIDDEHDALMGEINMTPLVDVMLVLLVIFLITLPVINHAVKIDLPQASSQASDLKPPHVDLAIAADGSLSWNHMAINQTQLTTQIAAAQAQQPIPELHIYADRHVAYEKVADVMAAAQSGGLTKIGFVIAPLARATPGRAGS
jgi:biopolymer transport protein ExbD